MSHEVLLAAAFSAGIVVIFSPCAAALLPAYLSYYLTREELAPSGEVETAPSKAFTVGLIAIALGLGALTIGLVDRVLTFGDRALWDAAFASGGAMLAVAGGWHLFGTRARMGPAAFARLRSQLTRGLLFGGAASIGIAAVYLAMGLLIRIGFSAIAGLLPWVAFGTAIVVVVLGLLMLFGASVFSYTLPVRGFRSKTLPGFAIFGAGYAVVASGCFLPLFLQVVAASLGLGLGEAIQVLAAYAVGSAAIFLLLSVSAAAARGATVHWLRTVRRHVPRIAGAVVVATGAYVLWYDWTFLLSRGL